MNLRISRPAALLAIVMLAATATAGCCEEESTAPDPVTPSAPAAATPKVPTPPKAAETPKKADAAPKGAEAPASEPASVAAVVNPDGNAEALPEGVVSAPEGMEGKSQEEIAAIHAEEDKMRAGFAKSLGVGTGEDWEVDYGKVADDSHLVVAIDEKGGDAPTFKAALVKGGNAEGTTNDLKGFTGADDALLAKFKKCDQWGQSSRQVISLGDAGNALRVSFWCSRKDGTANELVTLKSAPAGAKTLADLKTLWVGEGGVAAKAVDKCQLVTEATFAVEGKELVRTRKTTAAFMAPPMKDDPEGGGEPVVVDVVEGGTVDDRCKAPEESKVDRFPLAI